MILAEPSLSYQHSANQKRWLEVLVDCPGIEALYIYNIKEDLSVSPRDIVSVPFGTQIIGGIAIKIIEELPENLAASQIKDIEDVIAKGYFPSSYWLLLNKVAEYYHAELITVIRAALPPGLLGRSQRRIRLKPEAIPANPENYCTQAAQQVLSLLSAQKSGDYSTQYLQRQSRQAYRGIRELLKKGWVESYLELPKTARPKQAKAVTMIAPDFPTTVTQKQRQVLEILRNRGGQLWLSELLQIAKTSASTVESLAKSGFVVIEQVERLRLGDSVTVTPEETKQLNSAQEKALEIINSAKGFAEILLHGVTGSGKTEVYLQAIASILSQGNSALVLVPEIGLTPQLTDRFRARFGNKVFVYHSALSNGERYDTWRQMLTGEAKIIIGTRSCIFAPLANLGLIILDEEHDSSFKQQQTVPNYHARTVAEWRAQLENCPLILGSATPSLESWHKLKLTQSNNSFYLSLPERIQSRPLPPVEIVDMRAELQRGNRSIFSTSLQVALTELSEKKQQGILFISRRGHSTFVSCRSCGYVIECPHCDVSLSYHYTHEGATELLRCHYCNYTRLHPNICPECSSPYLKYFGTGTQRVDQEINKLFPQLRCIRFDSDTTSTKGAHRILLERFANKEADLLVGTQMLTKGLDIAEVTLVGVIAADGLLHRSDYRASERAFQTLTQVAGRAGRGSDSGKVIIQTYSVEHPVIEAVKTHDYLSFTTQELQQREALNYPPYGRLILLRFAGVDEQAVQNTAQVVADACIDLLENVEILGPAPANIARVASRYRWQILLKFSSKPAVNFNILRQYCPSSISMNIDVDPINID